MSAPFRVVVAGPPHWANRTAVDYHLDRLHVDNDPHITVITRGRPAGVDQFAAEWVRLFQPDNPGVVVEVREDDWVHVMQGGADLVIVFGESTSDVAACVRAARAIGIPVKEVGR